MALFLPWGHLSSIIRIGLGIEGFIDVIYFLIHLQLHRFG
jgi:hypothetical protein